MRQELISAFVATGLLLAACDAAPTPTFMAYVFTADILHHGFNLFGGGNTMQTIAYLIAPIVMFLIVYLPVFGLVHWSEKEREAT